MTRPPTIDQLCAACHNEDAHTEHVTRLALVLFDAVRRPLGIAGPDRRLLAATCRLHDVGYFRDPVNHANAGASLLMKEGLRGFSKSERRDIAAAVLLHQKRYEKRLRHGLLQGLPRQGRAFRLAAILRVADGLDHGHIQNVSISSIRRVKGEFRVLLRDECYQRNAPAAEAKSDLWRKVFPCGIVFQGRGPRSTSPRLARVLGRHDSLLETVRRLLCVHYRIIDDNRRGAAAAAGPEPLHDIRVAIRRLCAALRVFREALKGTSALTLAERFSRVNSGLGPIRDSDVWMVSLSDKSLRSKLSRDKAWPAYLAFQKTTRRRNMKKLRLLLRSRRFTSLMEDAEYFGRIELPDLMRRSESCRAQPFAAEQLRRLLNRVVQHEDVDQDTPPDDLHDLRKLCRRGRYYAEFFTPALGNHGVELAARFRSLADPLGRIHDADVALARIAAEPVAPPKKLRKILLRRRKTAWKDFLSAWETIRRRRYHKRVARSLQ